MTRSSATVRLFQRQDLAFADQLRALAGWNQTLADWERFLEVESQGCFLGEWQGTPAGTAVVSSYGKDLAWIGMVLVHPDFRRRGIGNLLMAKCLEFCDASQIRVVKLDATPLGVPLYAKLGFVRESTLTRWHRAAAGSQTSPILGPLTASDLSSVAAMDTEALGANRSFLLGYLARQAAMSAAVRNPVGSLAGFGLLRAGALGSYLGPVISPHPESSRKLIQALLCCSEPVIWDIPDENAAAVAMARGAGFTPMRELTRMRRGPELPGSRPDWIHAIAGPELG